MSLLISLALLPTAGAANYSVCAAGCDFDDLQAAFTAAVDGDAVLVHPGAWNGNFDINDKSITVTSRDGATSTTIAAPTGGTVLRVRGNGSVVVRGFRIGPSSNAHCIDMENQADLLLEDSTVQGCSIDENGAGLRAKNGNTTTVRRVTFRDNDGPTDTLLGGHMFIDGALVAEDSVFMAGRAQHGGAIYAKSATLTLEGNTFDNNRATAAPGHGGAIYLEDADAVVDGSRFDTNSVTGQGGSIYAMGASSLLVSRSVFQGGSASDDGGAIYIADGDVELYRNTFRNHSVTSCGGAVYVFAGTGLYSEHNAYDNNTADDCGGHLYVRVDTTDYGSSYTNGEVAEQAGAIRVNSQASYDLTDGVISHNLARGTFSDSGGGGLHVQTGGTIGVYGVLMDDNRAGENGGHIWASDTTDTLLLDVWDSQLLNGQATDLGGALYLGDNVNSWVSDSVLRGNTADRGGALHLTANAEATFLERSEYVQNTATTSGGAVYGLQLAYVDVLWNTFDSNDGGTIGGAVHHIANDVGGGLYLWDNAFSSNSADQGGAVSMSQPGFLDLQDNVFDGNTGATGGAVELTGLTSVFSARNTFCGNTATDATAASGGAVAMQAIGAAELDNWWTNNIFQDNSSTHDAGAVAVTDNFATLVFNHFVGNRAQGMGGALQASSVAMDVRNNLIAYTPTGDGVHLNSVTGPLDYNGWFDNKPSNIVNGVIGSGAVTTDPMLTAWSHNGLCDDELRPANGSPLIGAGDPALPSPRDIGAFGGDDCPLLTWYPDTDGDFYGDSTGSIQACHRPDGYVLDNTDCDDADPAIHPETEWYEDFDGDGYGDPFVVTEQCTQPSDYVANKDDCDDVDATLTPLTAWYADLDGDGYGDPNALTSQCNAPWAHVSDSTDCDDTDAEEHPGADWYADTDNDGYGDAGEHLSQCTRPSGYVADDTDCDDTELTSNPGRAEVCDSLDNDCDGLIDDDDTFDASTGTTFYEDADLDGYGHTGVTDTRCAVADGWSSLDTDCDDADASSNPGAPEQCDTVDHDCDGAPEQNTGNSTWYLDSDGDGVGDSSATQMACLQPANHVSVGGDCDDSDAANTPGGTEICDGQDNDCDSGVDEGVGYLWYADADGDGYGDASGNPSITCNPGSGPQNTVDNNDDCDDLQDLVNPAALEVCNNTDDDCDGTVDNVSVSNGTVYYEDADNDGVGGGTGVAACPGNEPAGWIATGGDCDDTDANVNPSATEICDGKDNDCNSQVDESGTPVTWYPDNDGDGFGTTTGSVTVCAAPSNHSLVAGDCNDLNFNINPDATETWYDGVDQDCDGRDDDQDGDGFGIAEDCDDTDPNRNPDAEEVANGKDDNCDGITDVGDDSVRTPDDAPPPDEVLPKTAGCGCDSNPAPAGMAVWMLLALSVGRRRS